jgi:hypothetical protein
MSELAAFGAHARAMSTVEHAPECLGENPTPGEWPRWVHPDSACPGCVTDADRALWARLADEVDAYLAPEPEETLL